MVWILFHTNLACCFASSRILAVTTLSAGMKQICTCLQRPRSRWALLLLSEVQLVAVFHISLFQAMFGDYESPEWIWNPASVLQLLTKLTLL